MQMLNEAKSNNFKISINDILASLKPLAEEFFNGEIGAESRGIVYTASNGQKFLIDVKELN